MPRATLQLLLAFALLLQAAAAVSLPPLALATCLHSPAPAGFDGPGFLAFDGEFHAHGDYLYNASAGSHEFPFTLTAQSLIRAHAGGMDEFRVEMDVKDSHGSAVLQASAAHGGAWRELSGALDEGTYTLTLRFTQLSSTTTSCTHMRTEVSVVPRALQLARAAHALCPASESFPAIDFAPLATGGDVHFASGAGDRFAVRPSDSSARFAKGYRFVVPAQTAQTARASLVTAQIGRHFPTGGFLSLLLQSNATATPDPPTSLSACIASGQCTAAGHHRAGESMLRIAVGPGSYALWIFWAANQVDTSIVPCAEFAFSLDIVRAPAEEDFLTCSALPLPASFEGEYLRRSVLVDRLVRLHSMEFTVAAESHFRAAAHQTRADIDLQLKDSEGTVVAYGFRTQGYEAIAAKIPAGSYTLTTINFGSYAGAADCDSYTLEVAVRPAANAGAHCASVSAASSPDISGLARLATTATEFHLAQPTKPFAWIFSGDFSQKTITSQMFTVQREMRLAARLGSNFLVGDVTFELSEGTQITYPTHQRNLYEMVTTLHPGTNYTLSVKTGVVQTSAPPSGTFPSCALFSLELDVVSTSSLSPSDELCGSARMIPESLNTPEFFTTTGSIHVFQNFRVPEIENGRSYSKSTTKFFVSEQSLFRMFAPEHHLDIDVMLSDETGIVASSTRTSGSESITYLLTSVGKNYTLETRFYHWTPSEIDPVCFVVPLELSIVPWAGASVPGSCSPQKLPQAGFIPDALPASGEFYATDAFRLQRVLEKAAETELNFTVAQNSVFRALVESDFAVGQLAVSLRGDSLAEKAGTLGFGSNAVENLVLSPGTYTLRIYEPAVIASTQPSALRSACIPFVLRVGVEVAERSLDVVSCQYLSPPLRLNSPAYLHALSGNMTRLGGRMLADVDAGIDSFEFTLNEPTLYRAFVPMVTGLDVDFWLRHGTRAQPGAVIDIRTGTAEEMLYGKLLAGDYVVQLKYYSSSGASCVSFPLEFALAPLTRFTAQPSSTQVCDPEYPPSAAVLDAMVTHAYHWSPTAFTRYKSTVSFTVDTEAAHFYADIASEFVSGGLSLELRGTVASGILVVNTTIDASPTYARLSIDQYLLPGSYTLTISDINTKTAPVEVQCAVYQLTYKIDTHAEMPADECMELERLPTDLSTAQGGSIPYGGPQSADGSVRIFGWHFFQSPLAIERINWINFNIVQDSVVRAFVRVLSPNDIDLYLYRNRSDTSSLVGSSLGTGEHESALWHVAPGSHDLKVLFFRTDSATACNYFHFGLAVKTLTRLQSELLCPAVLPPEADRVPPAALSVTDRTPAVVASDSYVFTSEFISAHTSASKMFAYRMALSVSTNASLLAVARFDMVAADLRLNLRLQSTGEVLASGSSDGVPDRSAAKNFRNTLSLSRIEPGEYFLDISENLRNKNLSTSVYCIGFGFDLTAAALAPAVPPVITGVVPATRTGIEPCYDMFLDIAFSQRPANVPSASSAAIAQWLETNNVTYLTEVGETAVSMRPASASLSENGLTLTLRFAKEGIKLSKHYLLILNAEKFLSGTGEAFSRAVVVRNVYHTAVCDCSGHGTCMYPSPDPSRCLYCVCNDPWSGDSCDACKEGFHPAGTTCVADEVCQADSCSGHGTCDDASGSIRCECDEGYANVGSVHCGACQYGYSGYPDCVEDNPDLNRGVCKALQLPTTLNTVAMLGWRGSVALSGEYFIDTKSLMHNMEFALTADSVFRVYAEPHKLDIDLWLYSLRQDGTVESIIDYSVAFSGEESMFHVLPGGSSATPKRYRLYFRFFTWGNVVVSDCESFELELAITPLSLASSQLAEMARACAADDKLPSVPFSVVDGEDVSYAPSANFTLRSSAAAQGRHFFWSHAFEIKPRDEHVTLLQARVGSRFFAGQVNLMLESSEPPGDHCSSSSLLEESNCVVGDSTMNGNYIERVVPAGKYVLWLYEPIAQNASLSACTLFDLSLSVKYVDMASTLFDCKAPELPRTFNTPGFLDASTGRMHNVDRYVVSGDSIISFKLSRTSHVRFAGEHGVKFALSGSGVHNTALSSNVLDVLDAGDYQLKIVPPSTTSHCLFVEAEMAIEPVEDASAAPACGTQARLPVLPTQISTLPFDFGPSSSNTSHETFLALPYGATGSGELVVQYSFSVEERAVLYTSAMSNFLWHSLGMTLSKYVEGTLYEVAQSTLLYNYQHLLETLTAGRYVLKLGVPSVSGRPAKLPSCVPFNFEFHVSAFSADSACELIGEPAPLSFDSERFLLPTGRMDFADVDFRVPTNFALRKTQAIPFTLANRSLFRAFVEPNGAVDIDIRVTDKIGRVLASGSNAVYTEEALYTLLPPGEFNFVLVFWIWDRSLLPACPTFHMQTSIEPYPEGTPAPAPCEGGSDHWPPTIAPEVVTGRYWYSSSRLNEDLHYQQREDEIRTHTLSFSLAKPANFMAQIGFVFGTAQLSLRLERYTQHSLAETYYAVPGLHRSTIIAASIPVGSYKLTLFEPVYAPSAALRCASYTFDLLIDQETELVSNDHTSLPSTLNSVSYLLLDGETFLSDTFILFRTAVSEGTRFTLLRETSLHVLALLEDAPTRSGDIALTVWGSSGAPLIQSVSQFTTVLPPGTYMLNLTLLSGPVSSAGVGVTLQGAFTPTQTLRELIAASPYAATCADALVPPVTLSPAGYYQYDSDSRQACFDRVKAGGIVQTLALSIPRRTLLWAQVGYDFSLAHFELSVRLADGTTIGGAAWRNHYDVRTLLPSGNHTLVLSVPVAPPPLEETRRCTPFTFDLVLSPNASSSGCTSVDVVPWDLNRYDGGCVRYGGPIDATGSLHLFHPHFGVPSGRTTDTIALELTQDSAISVLLSVLERMTSISATLVDATTGAEIAPLGTARSHGVGQQLLTFSVSPGMTRSTKYKLVLSYGMSTSASCATFMMQIVIRPLHLLQASLVCEPGFVQDLPETRIIPGEGGFASDLHDSAFLSSDSTQRGAPYWIDLTVNVSSQLSVGFSFDSLINLYTMNLYMQYGQQDSTWVRTRGTWRAQTELSGVTTVTLTVADTIPAGNYRLLLVQPNFTAPLPLATINPPLCLPFIYTVQLVPQTGAPYVSEVAPARARGISPEEALVIWVRFSEVLFADSAATIPADSSAVLSSFYLARDAKQTISPSKCEAASQDGLSWTLTFPPPFAAEVSYRLSFVEGKLFDSEGTPTRYSLVNLYSTIDPTCNTHGELMNGTCVCDEGYGGANCRACDVGYIDVGEGTLRCVPSMTCEEFTCGCVTNETTGECIMKLGLCSIDPKTGRAVCNCALGYNGTYCHECQTGWSGWPLCHPCLNNGTWVQDKGVCICPKHWAGQFCDRCDSGWKLNEDGTDCVPRNTKVLAGILAVALAVLAFAGAVGGFMWYRKRKAARGQRYELVATDGDIQGDDDDGEDMLEEPESAPEVVVPPSSAAAEADDGEDELVPSSSTAAAATATAAPADDFFSLRPDERGGPLDDS